MKILFDTNIVLDLLLSREPFVADALQLFSKLEKNEISGLLCATTITTIHYLITKSHSLEKANQHTKELLTLFDIAPVNRAILEDAVGLQFKDFEDAVLHEAARHNDTSAIVTRDLTGFQKASLIVYSPKELINILNVT